MEDDHQLHLTYDPLDELLGRARPDNPKTHFHQGIADSYARHGYIGAVIVNDRDGLLLEGHGRLETLAQIRSAGLPRPPGIMTDAGGNWCVPTFHGIDLDKEQARSYGIAANRLVVQGGFDDTKLVAVLAELEQSSHGLFGTGYGEADLTALFKNLDRPLPRAADADEAPPVPTSPEIRVRFGELYALGEHRLLVGDSRKAETFSRLRGEEQAGQLVTDPPYGVSYAGKTARRLTIAQDDADDLPALLAAAFPAIDRALQPGAAIYVFHPAGPLALTYMCAFVDVGWQFRQQLIWTKNSIVVGHGDFHYRHEPILFGYKPGGGRRGRGGKGWYGGDDASSVFEVPRPSSSQLHPTAKPVELLVQFLRLSSRRGDIVLDPFLGSGSTLIAAERIGRRCFGVEIDPAYAQVAINRWEILTGRRATKITEGGF